MSEELILVKGVFAIPLDDDHKKEYIEALHAEQDDDDEFEEEDETETVEAAQSAPASMADGIEALRKKNPEMSFEDAWIETEKAYPELVWQKDKTVNLAKVREQLGSPKTETKAMATSSNEATNFAVKAARALHPEWSFAQAWDYVEANCPNLFSGR